MAKRKEIEVGEDDRMIGRDKMEAAEVSMGMRIAGKTSFSAAMKAEGMMSGQRTSARDCPAVVADLF
ncbi:hypothetical protein SESBI_01168 [Sesbania bispinosa]|nr:hypothetical protein SESBI_01168 [Sesbania bispinosa]